jgi:hypothetical protein
VNFTRYKKVLKRYSAGFASKILWSVRLLWYLPKQMLRFVRFVFHKAENFYHLSFIAATAVAGWWTYHLFISERNSDAHLYMDAKWTISTNTPSLGERRLVFLDVFLDNTGKRQIIAKRVSADQVAYSDAGETDKYSCGVQIRTILTSLILTNKSIDWFNDTNLLQCPYGVPP